MKPLREEGIKVSAHSFRKRFLNDWERARKLNTGKYIAGKKIPHNDSAYLELKSRYFEEYRAHYAEYINLGQKMTVEQSLFQDEFQQLLQDTEIRESFLRWLAKLKRE